MILSIHIAIALASLLFSGITYIFPSQNKIRVSYGFIAATIISGSYLVWITRPTHMASVCLTGLTFLGISIVAVKLTQRKLA